VSWLGAGLGVLVLGALGYVWGRWGSLLPSALHEPAPEPFYPLTTFCEGGLDERVVDEVVATTLQPVPRGVPGTWDTADLVAVPLRNPGAVLHRIRGKWAADTVHWLPPAGDPLRRCIEQAATESAGWQVWLNHRLKRA